MSIIDTVKNWNIDICKFNTALFLQSILLLTPVTLLFYQENGLTVGELFLFQSIFYLTSIIMEIPIGYLSDTINRKNVLIISFSIYFFIITMWLCFKGYWIILLGETLYGISKVMKDNAASGYLYDYLKSTNRQETMATQYGYLNFYLAIGTTVAALVGTFLFVHYGSHVILITQMFIVALSIFLLCLLPKCFHDNNRHVDNIKERIVHFADAAKKIYKNESIMNYIYYSGLLTSFSVLFALSFQPLMQNAMFPIALFGIAAFLNHGTRAGVSALTGKISKLFNIRKMIIPLFILYIFAFICIFILLRVKSIPMVITFIAIICLIIGVQLLFTIRHVSRLHEFVTSADRGNLMSINNFFSRSMTFVILFTSKLLIDKVGFTNFYTACFCLFLVVGTIMMINAYKIKEKI